MTLFSCVILFHESTGFNDVLNNCTLKHYYIITKKITIFLLFIIKTHSKDTCLINKQKQETQTYTQVKHNII